MICFSRPEKLSRGPDLSIEERININSIEGMKIIYHEARSQHVNRVNPFPWSYLIPLLSLLETGNRLYIAELADYDLGK